MAKIESTNFVDADVVLDGNEYRYCSFSKCRFIYSGGFYEIFEPVHINGCRFLFRDCATRTVELLRRFELMNPQFTIPFDLEEPKK